MYLNLHNMPQHFIKVTENFTCDHCHYKTTGSGYTNHCPACLYSKHVDSSVPGDRSSQCQGLMKPIGLQIKGAKVILFHQCKKCHKITRNKASQEDNQATLIKISQIPFSAK